MIAVIDCGLGNTGSVLNMIKKVGGRAIATADHDDIRNADKLILPGVGKFDYGMTRLQELGLADLLTDLVNNDKKVLLGICLGMQLLTEKSEEGSLPGLGFFRARTVQFDSSKLGTNQKIPHMGWNTVNPTAESMLLQTVDNELRYYFVHSYHVVCDNQDDVMATTHYGYDFVSAIRKENIIGVQFHPEKSHLFGMAFMKSFIGEGI